MIAMDPYGNFIPGPHGLPQLVCRRARASTRHEHRPGRRQVEGNLARPVPVPANVMHFDTPFLTDIAHNADPSPVDTDNNPATPPVAPSPDVDLAADDVTVHARPTSRSSRPAPTTTRC